MVNYLNHKLYGLTIDQVTASLINELKRRRLEIPAGFCCWKRVYRREQVGYLGEPPIFEPTNQDVEKVRLLISQFEQKSLLSHLLEKSSNAHQVVVNIGQENLLKDIHECTLVTSTYSIQDKTLGTVGILGPTRMDYGRVIGIINYLVNYLNLILNASK